MNKHTIPASFNRFSIIKAALLFFIAAGCIFISASGNNDFEQSKQEILLRKIGHEVLLQAGDSTSRVLPVKKVAENEFQIRFENEFVFRSDSLVTIVRRTLETGNVEQDYIVNVLNCSGRENIFGWAVLAQEKNTITPCTSRPQPKGCYIIELKFQPGGLTGAGKTYLVGGMSLALIGLLAVRPFKLGRKKHTAVDAGDQLITIGNTVYDAGRKQIEIHGVKTELTIKENKLLSIFAASPNIIIERARIQKEIWEDEGVIVGRSLDVFISRLRKKMEQDPSLQIINIHGKGYKLEIAGI